MPNLHCNYDVAKYEVAYKSMPQDVRDRMALLREQIVEHLQHARDINNRLRAIRAYETEKTQKERNGYAAVIAAVSGIAFLSTKIKSGKIGVALGKATDLAVEKTKDMAVDKSREVAVVEVAGENGGNHINFLIDALTMGTPGGAFLQASKPASIASEEKEWSLALDNENDKISRVVSKMIGIVDSYYGRGVLKAECALLGIGNSGAALKER